MPGRSRQRVGRAGEDAAAAFLVERGYTIVERNYRIRLGEIDLIAEEGDVLCFVEVKARRSERLGHPSEAVTRRKRHQIAKVAAAYMSGKYPDARACRFDVVTVMEKEGRSVVDLTRDAFRMEDNYTV